MVISVNGSRGRFLTFSSGVKPFILVVFAHNFFVFINACGCANSLRAIFFYSRNADISVVGCLCYWQMAVEKDFKKLGRNVIPAINMTVGYRLCLSGVIGGVYYWFAWFVASVVLLLVSSATLVPLLARANNL